MKKILVALVWMAANAWSQAQTHSIIVHPPLDIAPALSGNFGELRPNHFHAGLDLKTGGREGLPVYAVADGYVSRIRISPYGYGKALYITHPNGYTTVYGHLSQLNDSILRYTTKVQYQQESFEIDHHPGKYDLPVKAGDIVAFSGNTGGSGGPHLHFEVRETTTEVPRNPFSFGFEVPDTQRPVIEAIGIAPIGPGASCQGFSSTQRFRVSGTQANTLVATQPIPVRGTFGIEVRGYDQQGGSPNQNGIYRLRCYLDDVCIADFRADSIPFDQSRFINGMIDYSYYYQQKSRFIRLYRLPGMALECVDYLNDGMVNATGLHVLKVEALDAAGNASAVTFQVEVDEATEVPAPVGEAPSLIQWDVPYSYESENASVFIPKGTLYEDTEETVVERSDRGLVQVLRTNLPAHQPFQIALKGDSDKGPQVLAQVTADGKPLKPLATSVDQGWWRAESKSFGYFALVVDAREPVITPLQALNGSAIGKTGVRFKIEDNFSGIQTFRVEINGQWVLAEYEYKQNLLFVRPETLSHTNEVQRITVKVSDLAGNVATFEGSFLYP